PAHRCENRSYPHEAKTDHRSPHKCTAPDAPQIPRKSATKSPQSFDVHQCKDVQAIPAVAFMPAYRQRSRIVQRRYLSRLTTPDNSSGHRVRQIVDTTNSHATPA